MRIVCKILENKVIQHHPLERFTSSLLPLHKYSLKLEHLISINTISKHIDLLKLLVPCECHLVLHACDNGKPAYLPAESQW